MFDINCMAIVRRTAGFYHWLKVSSIVVGELNGPNKSFLEPNVATSWGTWSICIGQQLLYSRFYYCLYRKTSLWTKRYQVC